ncbi:hypothetical protein POM88_034933 [Heracleum sosnowskyi]|uniref:Transmembrane protein n=1 Tax=Heracleum sosnowskyi TaxID=360622 RepID=A0AAD8HKI8_9APIA|nr:hypothetical protein POM88_034933 [Heracleum sosnowskyi]
MTISNVTAHTDDPTLSRKRSMSCCCLTQYVSTLVIIFILLLSLVFGLGNLLTKEYNPKLEINSFKVVNLNLSSRPNQISADWNVQMNLKNMDSHGYLKFSHIQISINYNDEMIAVTNITSFVASPKDPPKHLGEEFSGSTGYMKDSIIINLSQGIRDGIVKFDIKFEAKVKKSYHNLWFKFIHPWNCYEDYLGNCKNVELFFGTSDVSMGQMMNDHHQCKFEQVQSSDSFRFPPYYGYGYGYGYRYGYGYGYGYPGCVYRYGYGYPGCV